MKQTHPPVSVIGLGMSPEDLTETHLRRIREAKTLVGGKRHLAYFGDLDAEKMEITANLREVADFIRERMPGGPVAVIASGDPLFYGIGSYLIRRLGGKNIRVYPNISSVAAAFARIGEAWHDARVISLHGKTDEGSLLDALCREDKLALLTDPQRSPAWLARYLSEKDLDHFSFLVLENLGEENERVRRLTLSEAAETEFDRLNLVILLRRDREADPKTGRNPEAFIGMPDDWFDHENGLITKADVRTVTISRLRLSSPDLILWDLGAGSGSVSIEAGLLLKRGRLFAVEQKAERIRQIRENARRFGVRNLDIIRAVLPEGMDALPAPDRIFIGGGGQRLETVIRSAAERLKPGGIMVINTVLMENIRTAFEVLEERNMRPEAVQIQVSVGKSMPWGHRLQAQNPVWIISGRISPNDQQSV